MTGSFVTAAQDFVGLLPEGSRGDAGGELVVGGCRLSDLAATYGTPLYIVEEDVLRSQARRFSSALASRWANARVVFASKAYPCTAIYQVMAEEGLGVDIAGSGELVMALAGGVRPSDIIMHGNAKTTAELRMAVESGVGTIVIDNFDDIDHLEQIVTSEQGVLIRVIPGVRPDTHEAISTGQDGSKFGLSAEHTPQAIARLKGSDRLRLDGLHMHIGSQILDTAP